jgi:hypothetical protein
MRWRVQPISVCICSSVPSRVLGAVLYDAQLWQSHMHDVQRLLSHSCSPGALDPAAVGAQGPTLQCPRRHCAATSERHPLCHWKHRAVDAAASWSQLVTAHKRGQKWSPLLQRFCETRVCGVAEPLQQAVSALVFLRVCEACRHSRLHKRPCTRLRRPVLCFAMCLAMCLAGSGWWARGRMAQAKKCSVHVHHRCSM